MMNPQDMDIRALLPQQPPMLMVDRLISVEEKSAEAVLEIRPDNIFVENGALKAYALIENMAQTCAAQFGYMDRLIHGCGQVRIGVIGSVKRMQIESVPRVGETLLTRMEVREDFMNMKLVSAESFVNDQRIAAADLTIAMSEERATV